MVAITEPEVIRRVKDYLGLRTQVINVAKNSIQPALIANTHQQAVPSENVIKNPIHKGSASVSVAGNTWTTLISHTVSSGKSFYLTTVNVWAGAVAADRCLVILTPKENVNGENDADVKLRIVPNDYVANTTERSKTITLATPIKFTAGQICYLRIVQGNAAAQNCAGSLIGYEVEE